MFIGLIAAILHGTTLVLPLLMVVFGETADVFSNEFITRDIARAVNELESVDNGNCTELYNICSNNETTEDYGFFVENSLCSTKDDLIDDINILVIYYCGYGLVAFICGWLHYI